MGGGGGGQGGCDLRSEAFVNIQKKNLGGGGVGGGSGWGGQGGCEWGGVRLGGGGVRVDRNGELKLL